MTAFHNFALLITGTSVKISYTCLLNFFLADISDISIHLCMYNQKIDNPIAHTKILVENFKISAKFK
jgi:hypothetical protein